MNFFGSYLRDGSHCSELSESLMLKQLEKPDSSRAHVSRNKHLMLGVVESVTDKWVPDEVLNPRVDHPSGLTVVADARLDDRNGLISRLEIASGSHETLTDPQLILLAYRRWGNNCVNHLLGAFAFVVADPRNNRIFCARDPIGAKPFYYHLSTKLFVFASSARAVAAHEMVAKTLNEGRVADLMVGDLQWINETETFFKQVSRMPPAHWMEIGSERANKKRYWHLDPSKELRLGSDAEYADAMQEVLEKAINDRTPANGEVGSMLSGGVDSSTIVGILRQNLKASGRSPLKTWSGISENEEGQNTCRETHFVSRVVGSGGLDSTTVSPSAVGLYQSELLAAERDVEDPFDFGAAMHKLIYLCARRAGCTTVFDGVDGDVIASLSTAYPTYLLREGNHKAAFYELRKQYVNYYRRNLPPKTMLGVLARGVLPIPKTVYRIRKTRGLAHSTKDGISRSFISGELASRVNLESRYAEYRNQSGLGLKASLRHEHISRIVTADLTAGVERYYRIASGMGVNNQQPLLDRRVIEFCVSLPWDQKCRDGWSKYALRNVASRFLPEDVAWRQGWEEIAGKFYGALRTINAKNDANLILDRGKSLSEYIDWPKAEKYATQRLAGSTGPHDSECQLLALINWHDKTLKELNSLV